MLYILKCCCFRPLVFEFKLDFFPAHSHGGILLSVCHSYFDNRVIVASFPVGALFLLMSCIVFSG